LRHLPDLAMCVCSPVSLSESKYVDLGREPGGSWTARTAEPKQEAPGREIGEFSSADRVPCDDQGLTGIIRLRR
jgi:hypothetical protein